MTAQTPTKPMTTTPPALTLERFFEHVRLSNPFLIDRVVQPAQAAEMDAETVHQTQFRQLVELARMARDQHIGVGVVLWGEAGVGKSHLLARLARWAHRDGQACFVYLQNLQPGPENLPRTLLRVTVSILTQGRQDRFQDTPLFRLVDAAVQTALQESAETLEPAIALKRLLDRLSAQAPAQPALVDRTIYNVLFRFLRSAALAATELDDGIAALAVRWLSGDPLDVSDARLLGLPPQANRDETVVLGDDQQIKLVLVALSQMALLARQPLLLCFDQVENISVEQMQAQARFLQALLDSAPNLLVVTCGVRETLLRWQEDLVIHAAAWDRLAQMSIDLPRVTPHEGRQIVESRLDHLLTPFLELEPVKERIQEDHLFPLGVAWFDEFLKDKLDLRPRYVIKWARDGWARAQWALQETDGPTWLANWGKKPSKDTKKVAPPPPLEALIDERVRAKLEEQKNQRRLDPETLPPDADNLAGLVLTLLQQCLDGGRGYALTGVERPLRPSPRQQPTYHLVVRQRSGAQEATIGVLFLTTGNATSSAAWAFRRILEDRVPPLRLLLVIDRRRPMRLGPKGEEYLTQLRRKCADRFQQIELTFDQYADLDALKATTGLARSGDLEIDLPGGEIRRVTETEVIASHHGGDRYAAHVLLKPLLNAPPPTGPIDDPPPVMAAEVNEKDIREFIMAQLGFMPGMGSNELTLKYVAYLQQTKRPLLDEATCKPQLEDVARAMHHAGLIQVSPIDDGLFLLPRKRPTP